MKILLLGATVLPVLGNAESVIRSEAQTAGEKRLLEWDLNKTYDISRSRTDPGTKKRSRSFETRAIAAGVYPTRALSAESFSASEFLSKSPKHETKGFFAKPPVSVSSAGVSKPFLADKPPQVPKDVPAFVTRRTLAPETFADSSRRYQGVEVSRKDRMYLPEDAPKAGVVEGRRLTIDEVKEILNKSK